MTGIDLLGATLLHFLWQGAAIAAIYAVARQCVSRPEVRYVLACVALAAMASAPVATWVALRPAALEGASLYTSVRAGSGASALFGDLPHLLTAGYQNMESGSLPSEWLSWVGAAWMAGVLIFGLRLLGGWIIAEQLRRRQVRPAPSQWQQTFDGLRARLGVSRPVQLLVSGLAQTPAVVGLLKPVVLVPVGALAGLPAEQMEALLLHKLAHIRRYDYLVNALQGLVEAMLFYHPAVWWVSGHMRSERELCCDDRAVEITGDAHSYARALAKVGAAAHAHCQATLAATGGSLANRVARLLGVPRPASRTQSQAGVAAAALIAITGIALLAQTTRPRFEVASIKPASGGPPMIQTKPGLLTARAPLPSLMQVAYDLQPSQIAGGPAWIGSEQFEINAKAAGNSDRAHTILMLRSLLEDRFRLQFHRESREMPIYVLAPNRGGLKLPSPREGICIEDPDALGPLADPRARMQPPSQGSPSASACGSLNVQLTTSGARMSGDRVPMAEFARVLSRVLGRTVTDRTEFSGAFDVKLDFLPDDSAAGLPPPPPGAIPFATESPSIFNALQQLGLRLESAKGPVDVFVIDHVERPQAN